MHQRRKKKTLFVFPRYPVQKRLPLLICLLLICIVFLFSFTAYTGMKNSAMQAGQERLNNLTTQLSSMFGQNAQALITATRSVAGNQFVKQFTLTQSPALRPTVQEALEKFQQDSTTVLVLLLNKQFKPLLAVPGQGFDSFLYSTPVLASLYADSLSLPIGKFYRSGDSTYHPVVIPVTNNNINTGYLVRWRQVTATPKTIEQLKGLLGTGATLYFGNSDGSFWTNLVKPVAPPPVNLHNPGQVIEFTDRDGNTMLATVRTVQHSSWLIMVAFSKPQVLSGTHTFLYRVIVIGTILILTGMGIAWLISRSITKPLNYLTNAASAIAAGGHYPLVEIRGHDELSKLGLAFNSMARQVEESRQDLENKIQQRTQQLENANKELEAFSYSVSHDLRSPLRAINGYSTILEEDYVARLDEEGIRLLQAIRHNATKMGTLIDDLLSFSRLNKQEIKRQQVDMKGIVEECIHEIVTPDIKDRFRIHVKQLPGCRCDNSMIRQVWLNLIGNAVKYSSLQNQGCIEIGSIDNDPHRHQYYIKDNGVGFDMKYAGKLFGIFQRLHSDTVFEGTGVGLALVKRILLKHDGDIRAQSSPGEGATFYFSLPKSIP